MNILKVFITLYTTLVIKNLTNHTNWLLGESGELRENEFRGKQLRLRGSE